MTVESTDSESRQAAAGKWEESVDDNLVLIIEVFSTSTKVERGPEHPKEEGANKAENVRVVAGSCTSNRGNLAAEDPADSESEIGSKAVDKHTASNIKSANGLRDKNFVKAISDDLDDSHDQELFGANLTDDSTEWNEDSCYTVWTFSDHNLVEFNIVISVGVALDDSFPERIEEHVELDDNSIDEEGVGKGGEGVGLNKGHQEAETNKHHHIDVLEGRVPDIGQRLSGLIGIDMHIDGIEDDD